VGSPPILVSLCNAYSYIYFDVDAKNKEIIMGNLCSLSSKYKNEFIAETIDYTIYYLKRL
jgi:hypothetical protein